MRPTPLFLLLIVIAAALAAPLLLPKARDQGPTSTTATTTTATTTEPVQRKFRVDLLRTELNSSNPRAEFYVPMLPTADWVTLHLRGGPVGYDPYPVLIRIRDPATGEELVNLGLGPWGEWWRWLLPKHLGRSYVVELTYSNKSSKPSWYIEIWIEYGVGG